jgi:predicted nucleic acid-binding protein
LSFDLDATLRWLKPQRRKVCPQPRGDEQLSWVNEASPAGGPLLLDTTVYIDLLRGTTPEEVDSLLQLRTCNHSAICLAEMTHAFGRLDPAHAGTAQALKQIRATISQDIPPHRLYAPGSDVWGSGGMLAGLMFRLRGYPKNRGHERKLLNDASLYIHARKLGCSVLTSNVEDFDILNQLVPSGRVIFYRRTT